MNLLETFESLDVNKSKKMVYDYHDVLYLKFDTNKRIGLKIQNVDIDLSDIKKFRGFYTRSIKDEKAYYIQTDGNLAERQIFCHMCEYILSELAKLKALDANDLESAIKGWTNFGRTNQDNLPDSIQLGLFGELLFLQFITKFYSGKESLLAWHGPERKKTDFVLSENLAVEIKAISDPLNSNVSISSVQQLSDGYKNHFLRVYKLVFSPNGKKITELFNELLHVLPNQEKDEFIGKCCDYGFNYLLAYDNLKPISNVGYNDYYVTDHSFPKLAGNFDPRINEIKYRISLENLSPLDSNYLFEELKTSSNS